MRTYSTSVAIKSNSSYNNAGDIMKETEQKIIDVIEKIRPFLISDGGDIEYVKFENGIVYVKMMGHCSHCPMLDVTLKESIEMAITSEVPEVIEVQNIADDESI